MVQQGRQNYSKLAQLCSKLFVSLSLSQLCWLPCKQGKCYEVQSIFTILVCCVSSAQMSRPPVCQGVNISGTTLPSLDIYNFTRENKKEWEYVPVTISVYGISLPTTHKIIVTLRYVCNMYSLNPMQQLSKLSLTILQILPPSFFYQLPSGMVGLQCHYCLLLGISSFWSNFLNFQNFKFSNFLQFLPNFNKLQKFKTWKFC